MEPSINFSKDFGLEVFFFELFEISGDFFYDFFKNSKSKLS